MARKVSYEHDAPRLTDAELAEMRPAQEVLGVEAFAAVSSVRKAGRPRTEVTKVPVTIRLDADTVATLKESGPRWQTRVNDELRRMAARLRRSA